MKNILNTTFLFLILLLLADTTVAQDIFYLDTINSKGKFQLKISGDVTAKSNTIENDFYKIFYRGGFIDEAAKSSVLTKLKPTNRFGGDGFYTVCFKQKFDKVFKQEGWSYLLRYSDKRYLSTSFTYDFFNVAFEGNHQYENKTAGLGPFQFNFFRYQQFGGGLQKVIKCKENEHAIAIVANYLNGKNIQHIDVTKADLFTAIDGEYLDLNLQGNFIKADTLKHKNKLGLPSKGNGFSMDFNYRFHDNNGNTIEVEANDFGYIKWNNTTVNYHQDTSIHWEGFVIKNVFEINDSIFALSTDSLKNSADNPVQKTYKMPLPTWFNLKYSKQIKPNIIAFVGANYRSNAVYLPFIYLGAKYLPIKSNEITAQIGYGGYGKWNLAFMIKQQFLHRFLFAIGTKQLEGFVKPKTGNGQSLFLSLTSVF